MVMVVCGREIRIDGRLLRTARLVGDGYEFLENPEELIAGLRQCGARIDLFTFMQRLPATEPKYQYPMEWDNYAALPIASFDKWWKDGIGFKARNKAKQAAKKGVVIREVPFDESLAHGIWQIYNESPVRQGRKFPHYGKNVETVYREAATYLDRSVFIGAYLEDQLIGFIKVVADETGTQAGLMNIVALLEHRDKAAMNALVAEAVRSCAQRGISFLVYSQFAYGSKERSSLSDFKERNGFERIDIPRYYVPLTSAGSLGLRLSLHKKLVERIPAPVASKLRDLREAWYARKLQSESGSV